VQTTDPKLYLLPVPLGEAAEHTIPAYVVAIIHELDVFIVERAKTARRFLKSIDFPKAFDDCLFFELNKRTNEADIPSFLDPMLDGRSVGLLSEAGVPAVADPGSKVVLAAHQREMSVMPLVGPSSLLLALMGAGMNGQAFAFKGYLSPKRGELARDLKRLESLAMKHNETQIFIETPYRNLSVFETALETLAPGTLFSIAMDLTLPSQLIKSRRIQSWKKQPVPDLHKRPVVFLIGK
jgi:16S rRNA (cytidine1402-2'-O)-methyltransferase